MKKNIVQYLWMFLLIIILLVLLIWAIWFIETIDNKISVFSIVTIIIAAFTSVLTVSINNKKAREREYELHVLKEKQKVYEHFYNSFFEILKHSKNKKQLPKYAEDELMLFKQGLMNWGSESLIKKYIEYDNKLTLLDGNFNVVIESNIFLKEIRREMGFEDSKNLNLISIILDSEARKELEIN